MPMANLIIQTEQEINVIPEDLLLKPLDTIQKLFIQANNQTENNNHGDWGVPSHFERLIGEAWDQIPSLNNHTSIEKIPNGSLVRYRGMIQDMFDPEFYLGIYENTQENGVKTRHSGKYTDVIDVKTGHVDPYSPGSVTLDRLPLLCVPIPGETEWCQNLHLQNSQSARFPAVSVPSNNNNTASKRKLDEDDEMDVPESTTDTTNATRRQRTDNTTPAPPLTTSSAPHAEGGCLVKIYDFNDSQFKLNEVYEFIGVLSLTPQLTNHTQEPDDFDLMEVALPPSSVLPRLHCVFFKKIDNHMHMIVPPYKPALVQKTISTLHSDIENIRTHLVSYLASGLGGDVLAAQYLLMNMLSRVYRRHETLSLGKFSLNITDVPENRASIIRESLKTITSGLLPKASYLPITIENLNNQDFCPVKDYESNRLSRGILQLSDGTHLLLDETTLFAGQLTEKGTRQLKQLTDLVMWSKLEYDFKYHMLEFPMDVSTLVLSFKKSILPCDCQVILNPTSDFAAPQVPSPLNPTVFLEKARHYLALCRNLEYSVEDQVSKAVQDDFVQARKADPNVRADSFHLWLTMARWYSVSFGESHLSLDRWKQMMQLEAQRTSRFASK